MFGLGVDELSGSWLDKFMNDTENPTTTYRISHVTGYGTPDEDGVRDIETETLELTIRQLRELIPHEVDVQWLLTSGSLGEHDEWVLLSTHTKNPTTAFRHLSKSGAPHGSPPKRLSKKSTSTSMSAVPNVTTNSSTNLT